MFAFVFFGLLAAGTAVRIDWSFETTSHACYVAVNATIGTPGQPVHLLIVQNAENPGVEPLVHVRRNERLDRRFREQSGPVRAGRIGDGVPVGSQPLKVVNSTWFYGPYGSIGLARAPDGSSFLQHVLGAFEQKAVVFTYDRLTPDLEVKIRGRMAVGHRAEDRCAAEWTRVAETSSPWMVDVEEFSVGPFTFDRPGSAQISVSDRVMAFPQTVFGSVLQALGSHGQGDVPCDAQANITFDLGSVELVLTPDEYIDRSTQNTTESCKFNAYETSFPLFVVPPTVLKRSCLLLDFEKNELGFADRLQ
ncbi:hypothetical protein M3Y99_00471800 [Aphelenchoides fujianensis]|nr:hypothetical protein M3Y99_00471800 [Aphelenchoides fujianensis]